MRAVEAACDGLDGIEPVAIAKVTIAALHDGATTRELDEQSVAAAVMMVMKSQTTRAWPPAFSRGSSPKRSAWSVPLPTTSSRKSRKSRQNLNADRFNAR
jgi:hypothetical protein